MVDAPQTTLLRIAAFLVDALSISLILILPASAVSYAMAWIGGSVKVIQIVWWVAEIQTGVGDHDVPFLHEERGATTHQCTLSGTGWAADKKRREVGRALRDRLNKMPLDSLFELLCLISLHVFHAVVRAMDHVTPFGRSSHKRHLRLLALL